MPETGRRQHLKIDKGIYVLILNLRSGCRLVVGKLGRFTFPAGRYAYVGSALGPGGLAARLGHHLHLAGHPHWHIDYLRRHAVPSEIWYGCRLTFDEHRWADILQRMAGNRCIAPGFGSSDCRCETHLSYFAVHPAIARFRGRQPALPKIRRRPIYRLTIFDGYARQTALSATVRSVECTRKGRDGAPLAEKSSKPQDSMQVTR